MPFPCETSLLTKNVGTSGVYPLFDTLLCKISDKFNGLIGRYPVDIELESLICFPLHLMMVPPLLRRTTPPLLSCMRRRHMDMPEAKNYPSLGEHLVLVRLQNAPTPSCEWATEV